MRPAHPGAILNGMIEGLREESGQPYTVTEIAKGLGVSRRMLSMIVNQKSSVSPEMAVKLSEAFATNADLWMNLQKDMIYGKQKRKSIVKRSGIS